jgi:lysine-specific demethylase 8
MGHQYQATSDASADREEGEQTACEGLTRSLRGAGLDVRPIPEVVDATAADLRRAIKELRRPTLLRGLADRWPARTAWNPTTLARTHGRQEVTALMDLPAGGVLFPKEQHHYERTLDFGEFIHRMLTVSPDSPCYLAYTRAAELFPPADYDFSPFVEDSPYGDDTRVWIGSAGTRSMLHSDLKDNLFCQIWGKKHFVLLPWQYSRAAYPFPDNLVNSQIDLADLDIRRFRRLRGAVLYSGTVLPGDILFMPRGCWHDVRSLTPSVSLNHWFGPPLTFRDYTGLLLKCGPRYWAATAKDFLNHGVLRRRERTVFFFSPPSTGKRLYDLLRWGDFSRDNDPATD